MAKVRQIERVHYCFRFAVGDQVTVTAPSDHLQGALGMTGTVTEARHQGMYAYDRYVTFPMVLVHLDQVGEERYMEEGELTLAVRRAAAPS